MKSPEKKPADGTDVFAAIAAQRPQAQAGLIEPGPPSLPKRFLPTAHSNPKAAFRPTAKLDTAAKLQRALAGERRRFRKFLRNLAPPRPSSRLTVPITAFDWRMEAETDRSDFVGTLNGAGQWQRVQIPHYGGPVGRAVACYRTTFQLTGEMLAKGALFVCFKGVDYKAHVFVNGSFLGSHEGFFAPFEFEFTSAARIGENVLVVKVENDAAPISDGGSWGMNVDGDKLYAATGPGWDDAELGWHHCPPGMGIYQAVTVEARPALHLGDLFVRPLPDEQRAEIWIEVFNNTLKPEKVSFSISVFGQNFQATVFRDRVFDPPQTAGPRVSSFRFSIDLPKPMIWDLDTPWLYQVQVTLPNGDAKSRQFGMRSFRMDEGNCGTKEPARSGATAGKTAVPALGRMFLNGREIRLRGANTMGFEQQDVIKGDLDQLRDDILLAKICRMNFLRLTQRPVQSEIYEMCDRLGLMTQTDLPLFGHLPRRQFCEAVRQAEEMERLVRCHPCNIMVTYINEPFPMAWSSKAHRQCSRPELERFFEAASHAVLLANPDRVIKPVDGDYDPPGPSLPDNHCYCCWYNGHGVDIGKLNRGHWQSVKPGWLYGCGEFGAEGLDPVNVMRKYYPKAWLPQSPDEESGWLPGRIKEAQTGKFHYMFFDTQSTLEGWVSASQRHQAWATRIMTEAFRRDSRMNSIAIHLFIDAWPSGWMKSIMDVDRQPKPAYFAYREALTPLMANIRTDRWAFTAGESMRFEFWICNDRNEVPAGARLRYQIEIGGKVVFAQQAAARVEKCRSTFQGFLSLPAPTVKERTRATLRLALTDRAGKVLHDTSIDLTVFPALSVRGTNARVTVLGARNGKAARLARELGLKPVFPESRNLPDLRGLEGEGGKPEASRTILIDDLAAFRGMEERVDSLVRDGATAVFLELPAGKHKLPTSTVDVESCGMGPRHFASRNTGHPMVSVFQSEDFRMWYDPVAGYIKPLLETTFTGEGWLPILTSGNGVWGGGEWAPTLAAAETGHGRGKVRVCQVTLAGRTATNPVAAMFARRLMGLD